MEEKHYVLYRGMIIAHIGPFIFLSAFLALFGTGVAYIIFIRGALHQNENRDGFIVT
jgi:amino acid permease